MNTNNRRKFKLISLDGLIAAALGLSLALFASPYLLAMILIIEW